MQIDVVGKIMEANVVDKSLLNRDIFAEEQFNDDEYMKSMIESDKYSLDEVRDFFLNEAPFIVINIYNDEEFIGKCSLAEQFYVNQFNLIINDDIIEIENNGKYEFAEYHSGEWVYEVVK